MRDIPFEPFVPRRVHCAQALADDATPIDPPDDHLTPTDSDPDAASTAEIVAVPAPPRPAECESCSVELRQRIIALAAEACARALKCAIVRNPLFVARFVDGALAMMGSVEGATVALHPDDARACADAVACDVSADGSLERGTVIVRVAGSSIGATIEERAELLVQAAADA